MARPETLSAPEGDVAAGPAPELSVVVTLFQEGATLDELRHVLGRVLEVAVHRDDDVAAHP